MPRSSGSDAKRTATYLGVVDVLNPLENLEIRLRNLIAPAH